MFEKNDEEHLIRMLGLNEVVLFLGAGFSIDATNSKNENLPIGDQFSRMLWDFLEYEGDYDYTPLNTLYEVFLDSAISLPKKRSFINDTFIVNQYKEYYKILPHVPWFKIYTINIDDLLEKIFRASAQGFQMLKFPQDEPKERDQFLEKTQIIHLHGKVECLPNEVIFSTTQYAKGAIEFQPFYEEFVREYSTKPVIFIGTKIQEPLFFQYIQTREKRIRDDRELRPRSFIISKSISKPIKDQLLGYNIVSIEASTEDFFKWLESILGQLPSKTDIITKKNPSLLSFSLEKSPFAKELKEFASAFEYVNPNWNFKKSRSLFLLGATPKWSDVANDYDAPRNITLHIYSAIENTIQNDNTLKCYSIIGSAGCGKSTILMRLGLSLARNGRKVYFTNSETLPYSEALADALSTFKERVVLLFDNAETVLGYLPYLDKSFRKLTLKPIIVISSRTNDFDRLLSDFNSDIEIIEYKVPNLERNEIEDIIDLLKNAGLLGKLNGLTQKERIWEFERRSKKQLLVSMKEATSGQGFDEIIKDEFEKIVPPDAKMLCLSTAIATDLGFSLSKGELLSISNDPPNNVLNYIERNLKDIILPVSANNEQFWIRHRTIANFIVNEGATEGELKSAFVNLLSALSAIIIGKKSSSRAFRLYREVINHKNLYYGLHKSIFLAREVYESLRFDLDHDFHFWLQYGSLELEGGDLILAENYLDQADSIQPNNSYVKNAKGHLKLKKSIHLSNNKTQAYTLREEAENLLFESMMDIGLYDPYVYHIYCYQMYYWIKKWVLDEQDKSKELQELLKICDEALNYHPKNKRLQGVKESVKKAYLYLAISPDERPEEPELPSFSLFPN